jgi:hypothetical protein
MKSPKLFTIDKNMIESSLRITYNWYATKFVKLDYIDILYN